MIKIAFIDDESKARETIINILQLSETPVVIVGEAEDTQSGISIIE